MELLPPADIKCINPIVMTVLTHVGHLIGLVYYLDV